MQFSYDLGDACWINVPACGEHGQYEIHRVSGRVEATYVCGDAIEKRYVIRLDDPDWPHVEVRDAFTMAPAEDAVMPFERGTKLATTDELIGRRGSSSNDSRQ